MRIAYTIGAYRLLDFVKLGVKQLQKLSPDSPILISDDRAVESPAMENIAREHGCSYVCPTAKRGHFAADFQSIVNAVAFAEANNCDVAVKVSQRFIFRKPESIDVIRKTFSDPNICVATPGRPTVTRSTGTKGSFSQFSILSDVVMIRVGCISPADLIQMYRDRLRRENTPWASFVECTVDEFHSSKFAGKTVKVHELTDPQSDPIYLRRYQAGENQYKELALENGFSGCFPLVEWSLLDRNHYMARPVVV